MTRWMTAPDMVEIERIKAKYPEEFEASRLRLEAAVDALINERRTA